MPDMTKLSAFTRPKTPPRPAANGAPHPGAGRGELERVDTPVRTRRRPVMIAAGVSIIAVAVVGAVGVVNGLRETQDVLVLSSDIKQGEAIDAEDLTVVKINSDAGLHVVLSSDMNQVLGKTVSTNQPAGTLLNPASLTDSVIPPKNMTVVGITVTPDKLPGTALVIGDMVRLVDTPRDQENSPVTAPTTTNAQVVAIHPRETEGQVTVDVLVPEAEANWVAARAATHRVAIVLDTRER